MSGCKPARQAAWAGAGSYSPFIPPSLRRPGLKGENMADEVRNAINALVAFVEKYNDHGLDRNGAEFRLFQQLDTNAFAACFAAQLTVSLPEPRPQKHLSPFGMMKTPSYGSSDGFSVIATEDWLQCMRAIVATADLMAGRTDPRTKPKRRGRPKADDETVQREARVAADWERARDTGTAKVDFAKGMRMKLKDFNALLDRVQKRESRSDK